MSDIVRVRHLEARLVAHDWPWARDNQDRIAANWERRRAIAPAIFNGPILMLCGLDRRGDAARARFFRTDYRHLLATLDLGGDGIATNGFAMGALRSRDGGLLLGEMAPGGANAGQFYFPAGTPDPSDVAPDGTVDLAGSILREIEEETGLGTDLCDFAGDWEIVHQDGRTAFMRRVSLALAADEAVARIGRHLAASTRPELTGIQVLRCAAEIEADRMPGFLPPYLRHVLAEGATDQHVAPDMAGAVQG